MKKNLFCFTLLSLALAACSSMTDGIDVKNFEPRSVFPAGQTSELFQQIAPAPQKFALTIKSDTSITCKDGTVISIPKDCFIDKDGNVVNENVTIEVVEATSPADLLRYNLQTMSGNRVLQTGGMIYIDAKAGDKTLALQKDASLYIELPTAAQLPGMKIFSGSYDSTGNVDWVEEGELEEGLVPMPLSAFEYTYHTRYKIDKVEGYVILDSIELHKNKAYENTYIATAEFQQRYLVMLFSSWAWWGDELGGYGYGYKKQKDGSYKIDETLLNIYTKNIDKPLWYADSLAYVYARTQEIQDSIRSEKERTPNSYAGYWSYSKGYLGLYKQRLGAVKRFDPRGVDLSKTDAKERLMEKGYTQAQAEEQLRMNNTRQRFLAEKKEEKRLKAEKAEYHAKVSKAFTTAFKINKLGWVNVDRFMDDPAAKEVELFVQLNSDSVALYDVTLLIPGKAVAMNGIAMGNNKYRFTKEEKMYSKLPVGDKAMVIAMSSKGKQPYFVSQQLTIQEKQNIALVPKPVSWKEVEETLAKMNK